MTENGEDWFDWEEGSPDSVSNEELVDRIKQLQVDIRQIESDIEDNREALHFALDVLAGQTDQYQMAVDDTDRDV